MRAATIGILLISSVTLGATDLNSKESKWAMNGQPVDSYSMIDSRRTEDRFVPPTMIFDLADKRSIVVALCGPKFIIESGAAVPMHILGSLSVEKMNKLGWLGPVLYGRVVLRVNTDAEKEILDKEIREFQEKHSCSYL